MTIQNTHKYQDCKWTDKKYSHKIKTFQIPIYN